MGRGTESRVWEGERRDMEDRIRSREKERWGKAVRSRCRQRAGERLELTSPGIKEKIKKKKE